jgi:hypothetical protein
LDQSERKQQKCNWERLTEHVAHIVEFRNVYVILVRKAEGQRRPCPGADRRIIVTWILRKWDIKVQVDSLGSGQDRVCEHGSVF